MLPLLTDDEVAAGQRYLSSFPPQSRALGEQILAEGHVQGPTWDMFEAGYRALVGQFWVAASFSNGRWTLRCSCANRPKCEHNYALLTCLLRDYSPQELAATPERDEKDGKTNLSEFSQNAIERVLGRRLNGRERGYINSVHTLWRTFQATGQIRVWELDRLTHNMWYLPNPAQKFWGEPPKNPYHFWLHIAHAIAEQRGQIPDFLRPMLDFSSIADSLAKLKREEVISRWEAALRMHPREVDNEESEPVDIRLALAGSQVRVEWKRNAASAFEPIKKTPLRELLERYAAGGLTVIPECSAICAALLRASEFDGLDLSLNGEAMPKVLNCVLRASGLAERIVNSAGAPLARPTERLSWNLEEVENGDCRLSFALPQNAESGKMLIGLSGQPALYVFENAVYFGPPFYEFLPPDQTHIIPAPVLESTEGIEFLHGLGVSIPPRLQALVERVHLRARIACQMAASYPDSPSELLAVKITAQAENGGSVEAYSEGGWSQAGKQRSERKNNRGKICVIDRSALKSIPRLIGELGLKWDWYLKRWQCRINKSFPEKFANWIASIPDGVELVLDPMLESFRAGPLCGTIQLDCTEAEIDWFDLKVTLNVADTELTPEEIKLLLNARGQYVRLKDKGWRKLEINITEEDDQALARLGLSMSEFSAEPQRLHALQLADESARKFLLESRVEEIRRRVGEIKTRVTPDVPAAVEAQLRPYQREGFHFLAYLTANRFGGILADDMGLGKTLQALTWLEWVRTTNKPAPSLVVCPKSVMETWRNEATRFVPSLRVKLWKGTDASGLSAAVEGTDLLVLNYAQLRSVGDTLTKVRWQAAILDEGQYIKNPDSQTAQVARSLRADYRLALSGTPIENRLLDLWSLMAFAMPGVLGTRAQFGRQFNINTDPLARRRLAARVRPFLLRRTKAQVAKDLPERVEEDLLCELEGEQRTLYRAEFKHAQQMLLKVKTSKELNEFRFHFLTSLLRLRQICCHPGLVNPDLKNAESAKLNACMELLEPLMEEGHKVLVFSQFVSMLEILKDVVKERGWQHFYLAGNTENRGDLVDNFQNAEGAAIFLISLKAGGFGLNLTAASYVVLFDPWWNPAVENQAIDRTHRIGQTRKVMAYRVLMKESIEEKIRALQRTKSAIAEDILGEENFAKSLTLTDLQFLFSDSP